MSEEQVYAEGGVGKTRGGRILAWVVAIVVLEIVTLLGALAANKILGVPATVPADKRGAYELYGYLITLATPAGLAPPFIAAALAFLAGIPMQRAAMRVIHGIKVGSESSALLAEMQTMGRGAADPSRMGRLVATIVSILVFELVTLGVVLLLTAGLGVGKGTEGALGPNPAGTLLVVTLGAVIGAAPPFIPLLSALLPGLAMHRKATQGLSLVPITESERTALLAEMNHVGASVKAKSVSKVVATVTASAITIVVMSVFVLLGGVVLGLIVDKGVAPGFVPALVILVLSPIALSPPFIPFVAGYFAGRGSFRKVVNDPEDSLPITDQERAQLQGELEATRGWIAKDQFKRKMDVVLAGVVTYLVMTVTTVAIWGIAAIFMPAMRIPSSAWPAYILLLLPPMVCLPPFLPLVIGLLAGMPLRRRVRETSPMFMG